MVTCSIQSADTMVRGYRLENYRQIFVGINIVDHLDVVGASPVGSAPATSSFST